MRFPSATANVRNSMQSRLRRYLRTYSEWRFAPPRVELHRNLERFGSEYGGYFLDPSRVSRSSIIYSLGIGEDISFDLSLISRFGVNVEAFDPTPRVAAWLGSQNLPPQFQFHATGIAGHDGEEAFYPPPREGWISHSVLRSEGNRGTSPSIRFPVTSLSTAMRLLGHQRIDILKMDIEGAEYAVIEGLVREKIEVGQLLIEFHHRLSSDGTNTTRQAVSMLRSHGMKLAYVCPRAEVFSFASVCEPDSKRPSTL